MCILLLIIMQSFLLLHITINNMQSFFLLHFYVECPPQLWELYRLCLQKVPIHSWVLSSKVPIHSWVLSSKGTHSQLSVVLKRYPFTAECCPQRVPIHSWVLSSKGTHSQLSELLSSKGTHSQLSELLSSKGTHSQLSELLSSKGTHSQLSELLSSKGTHSQLSELCPQRVPIHSWVNCVLKLSQKVPIHSWVNCCPQRVPIHSWVNCVLKRYPFTAEWIVVLKGYPFTAEWTVSSKGTHSKLSELRWRPKRGVPSQPSKLVLLHSSKLMFYNWKVYIMNITNANWNHIHVLLKAPKAMIKAEVFKGKQLYYFVSGTLPVLWETWPCPFHCRQGCWLGHHSDCPHFGRNCSKVHRKCLAKMKNKKQKTI